jgi:hypothetical protein
MQTEYTSLNEIPGLGPFNEAAVYDASQYHDFYRNRAGNFTYRGEDETDERTPRFYPNTFFGRGEVAGVYPTPFQTVEVKAEGKTYHLIFRSEFSHFFCDEVWREDGPGIFSEVHVLRLPQDHPATALFVTEQVGTSRVVQTVYDPVA